MLAFSFSKAQFLFRCYVVTCILVWSTYEAFMFNLALGGLMTVVCGVAFWLMRRRYAIAHQLPEALQRLRQVLDDEESWGLRQYHSELPDPRDSSR